MLNFSVAEEDENRFGNNKIWILNQ